MAKKNHRLFKKQLLEQAAAYLITGIIISISHHFHSYPAIIFFGHLLIAISFLVLISTSLNNNWMRRIAGPLDIFSGTTLVITFAFDVVILIIDEIGYYNQSKLLPQNLSDSLFITILIAVFFWLFLLCIPLIMPAFNPRLSIRARVPTFTLITALALYLANYYLKIFPPQNVLLIALALIIGITVLLHKNSLPKLKLTLIHFSHLFLVLIMAFALGGILSVFTKAVPANWFGIFSLVSICAFGISILILYRGRRRLFKKVHMFLKMKATGMVKNVIVSEVEFSDFQSYCGEEGFDLSYFSCEISGSEEEIEWYQFDTTKVVKFKKYRFRSKGIPYDVAEWQQEKWKNDLARLVNEFFNSRRGANKAR